MKLFIIKMDVVRTLSIIDGLNALNKKKYIILYSWKKMRVMSNTK